MDDRECVMIRRNDYIAAIRDSISYMQNKISECKSLLKDIREFATVCSYSRSTRHIKKVLRLEARCVKNEIRFYEKHEKKLKKLLLRAEKYIPGSNEQH